MFLCLSCLKLIYNSFSFKFFDDTKVDDNGFLCLYVLLPALIKVVIKRERCDSYLGMYIWYIIHVYALFVIRRWIFDGTFFFDTRYLTALDVGQYFSPVIIVEHRNRCMFMDYISLL